MERRIYILDLVKMLMALTEPLLQVMLCSRHFKHMLTKKFALLLKYDWQKHQPNLTQTLSIQKFRNIPKTLLQIEISLISINIVHLSTRGFKES